MRSESVRDDASDIFRALLSPLAKHALKSGVSAREIQLLWRVAIVGEAARHQTKNYARINVAGIAASTGISRSEISRILKALESKASATPFARPHSINKVLVVWNSSPGFSNKNGYPKQLKIYGSGKTFEKLVKENAGGLPVRAVLDELMRLGSVEVIESKEVRLITAVPRNYGQSTREVRRLAEQVAQLLDGLLQRMRSSQSELSISSIDGEIEGEFTLPIFRKQVLSGGDDLLTDLRESINDPPIDALEGTRHGERHHVRVAVIYQQSPSCADRKTTQRKRKNYRRRSP